LSVRWPPIRPPGSAPSSITSACEPHRAFIESQLKLNRNAMAVFQGLVDQFGFTATYNSVKLPRQACFELHTLKFIAEGANALIIGKPGTGKSHIAKAVA